MVALARASDLRLRDVDQTGSVRASGCGRWFQFLCQLMLRLLYQTIISLQSNRQK